MKKKITMLLSITLLFSCLLSLESAAAPSRKITTAKATTTTKATSDKPPTVNKVNYSTNSSAKIVNPNQVYTYKIMENDIKALAAKYPDIITYTVIGQSEYGRNIYAVSLGKGKAVSFINGSTHAREWITTIMNMYMIEYYANAFQNNQTIDGYNARTILDKTTIWFVPMVNPDGVTLQQSGLKEFPQKDHDALIKMNNGSTDFGRWKANGKGVDLNRNYDGDWKSIKLNPGKPSYQFYGGKKPLDTTEAKVMTKFTIDKNPEMVVSYHSTGRVLYWWFNQTGETMKQDLAYAKQIGKLTGYQLMPAKNDNSAGGTYTDWVRAKLKKPALTPEMCAYTYQASAPLSCFTQDWNGNKAVGLYAAQESYKLYDARVKKETLADVNKPKG